MLNELNKSFLLGVVVVAALLLVGCSAPRTVTEHHHHYAEADTMAVQAQVDKRLSDWHEVMVKEVCVAIQSLINEQSTSENTKERVTETITTWVDSLGREMRQEQRTTERDISRQQQQREQRMQQEWESRLTRITDSLSAAWQMKFDRFQVHWAEADSTATEVKPAAEDARPWWKRWRDALWWMLAGAAFAIIATMAAKWRNVKCKM